MIFEYRAAQQHEAVGLSMHDGLQSCEQMEGWRLDVLTVALWLAAKFLPG